MCPWHWYIHIVLKTVIYQETQCAHMFFTPDALNVGLQADIGSKVEGIEELLKHTKFTRQELQRMYRGFKNVSISLLSNLCLLLFVESYFTV